MKNSETTVNPTVGSHAGVFFKIGVVTATFNSEITLELENGALRQLARLGVLAGNVVAVRVPGAFEIPLAAQVLFETQQVDGVVALGAVIRGETTHYDYVCAAVERGCSELALRVQKPVGFGVLTTENDEQAVERTGGKHGHKGEDAATVVVEMCNLLKSLQESSRGLDAAAHARYNTSLSKEVSHDR